MELISQLQDDSSPLSSDSVNSIYRKGLRNAILASMELAVRRIEAGETNVKGHVFLSALVAQIDSMQARLPLEQRMMDAARKSVEFCCGLLRGRMEGHIAQQVQEGGGGPKDIEDYSDSDGLGWDVLMQESSLDTDVVDSFFSPGWDNIGSWP